MVKTVVGYVRVSKEEMARDGMSLEAQEAKIRAWHELHGDGRELVVEPDESTGTRMDRPGLTRALALCGRGGALVAYSLSRVARSTRGMLDLAARLEADGCDLVVLNEKIDTSTATGKLFFRFRAALDEFERDQIAERTSEVLRHMARRGLRVSYRETSSPVAAARAAELRGQGLSLRAIAARLSDEGHATVTGARWSAKVVRSMVRRAA